MRREIGASIPTFDKLHTRTKKGQRSYREHALTKHWMGTALAIAGGAHINQNDPFSQQNGSSQSNSLISSPKVLASRAIVTGNAPLLYQSPQTSLTASNTQDSAQKDPLASLLGLDCAWRLLTPVPLSHTITLFPLESVMADRSSLYYFQVSPQSRSSPQALP